MKGGFMVAEVLVSVSAKGVDRTFTYLIPECYVEKVTVGIRVLVSFASRKLQGFVLAVKEKPETSDYELKSIIDIIDQEPLLNDEMLELGRYIQERTLCSLVSAYQAMLPTALKAGQTRVALKMETYFSLAKSREEVLDYIAQNKRSETQNDLLRYLLEHEEASKKELISKFRGSLKSLREAGFFHETKREVYRSIHNYTESSEKFQLNSEQQIAVDEVCCHLHESLVYLLYGVTGSGKTEVYMQTIEAVLKQGRTVLMLVPEISLTPQIIARFQARFGSTIAMIHSSLSLGERYDEWRRIQRGEVKIVIGARSAIFAPVTDVGLIIMDEEQSDSYKQDSNPRYHTLDIAKWRSQRHQCPIILGSATPTLESYARAETGKYHLLTLQNRVHNTLPKVLVLDMRQEMKKGNVLFSDLLRMKIQDRLNKHEQVILLLNRRGYSTCFTCQNCGHVESCPHCEISLTYHKTSDVLRCHYCGYAKKKEDECSECHSHDLRQFGTGTEKVEEELCRLFDARVIRMDFDTTSRKGSHEKIVEAFRNHEYDILLGTQVIAKGHDFPEVTLVGVLNGDTSLNIPDFRSSERTFQLLSQTAGRAGRSDLDGEVIIQTFNPTHYSIVYAAHHDYLGFYRYEMNIRKKLKYPPFYHIILVKISSKEYEVGVQTAKVVKKYLEDHMNEDSILLGPSPSPMFKMNDIYYFQCVIKFKQDATVMKSLSHLVLHYAKDSKVSVEIDTNPQRL